MLRGEPERPPGGRASTSRRCGTTSGAAWRWDPAAHQLVQPALGRSRLCLAADPVRPDQGSGSATGWSHGAPGRPTRLAFLLPFPSTLHLPRPMYFPMPLYYGPRPAHPRCRGLRMLAVRLGHPGRAPSRAELADRRGDRLPDLRRAGLLRPLERRYEQRVGPGGADAEVMCRRPHHGPPCLVPVSSTSPGSDISAPLAGPAEDRDALVKSDAAAWPKPSGGALIASAWGAGS
jgi:hypothetical protein